MMSIRRFSTSVTQLNRILPAVKISSQPSSNKSTGFERNFPIQKRQKAWEKAGEDKETFFKKRYAHAHAKDKQREVSKDSKREGSRGGERNSSRPSRNYDNKFDRGSRDQRRPQNGRNNYRQDSAPLFDKREAYSGIRPSPLSEFIYGSAPVLAALKAQRREYFSRLLIYNPKPEDENILRLAQKHDIKIRTARDKNELNILSNNGVHNGFVLETKPMVPQPIHNLSEVDSETGTYRIIEDFIGETFTKEYQTKNLNPLGVYLDEVTDPHNIGAIIRSAYFLGADFVVVSDRNCAPLSPVVSKTSVGALEFLPVYSCSSPLSFLEKTRKEGWTIVSAGYAGHFKDSRIDQTMNAKKIQFKDLDTLLPKAPVLLVLGSEGEGLRTTIKLKSDHIVEIDSGANVDPVIDSLNVSVASALLIQKVLDCNE